MALIVSFSKLGCSFGIDPVSLLKLKLILGLLHRHFWLKMCMVTDTCDYSPLCHFLILLLVSVSCHLSVYVSMLLRFWDWEGPMVWWKRVWLRLWRIQLPYNLKGIKILVLLSWFESKMKISHFGFENKKRVDSYIFLSFAYPFCFFDSLL